MSLIKVSSIVIEGVLCYRGSDCPSEVVVGGKEEPNTTETSSHSETFVVEVS